MFERFTDRSRRVLVLAQEEARLLDHNFIGTEHLLLGLLVEGEGVAAKSLEALGISAEVARTKVMETIGPSPKGYGSAPPFTARAKKVLELALREALQLGHNYIGTEHLLLGVVREGEGVGAQVLVSLGADLSRVRRQVIQLLSGFAQQATEGGATTVTSAARPTSGMERLRFAAAKLAGSAPVGTHHVLLSMFDDEASLAAKALQSFGLTRDQVAARIEELGTAGTTDDAPSGPDEPPAGAPPEAEG